jgi:hypothetical protein
MKIPKELHQLEISLLAEDGHRDALISYGADMYHHGLIKGTMLTLAGVTIGVMANVVFNTIQNRRSISEFEKKLKEAIKANKSGGA